MDAEVIAGNYVKYTQDYSLFVLLVACFLIPYVKIGNQIPSLIGLVKRLNLKSHFRNSSLVLLASLPSIVEINKPNNLGDPVLPEGYLLTEVWEG